MNKRIFGIIVIIITSVGALMIKYEGLPGDSSLETAWKNGELLNVTLNQLKPGDELM